MPHYGSLMNACLLAMAFAISAAPAAAAAPIEQDLVIHLAFDGSTTDTSARGNLATAQGTPGYVAGRIDQALDLGGAEQYVDLGAPADLQFGADTDFMVSLWIKLPRWGADFGTAIVGNRDLSAGGTGWSLTLGPDGSSYAWSFKGSAGSEVTVPTGGYIGDSNWRHLAVTHDRDGYKNIEEYINSTNAASDGKPVVNIRATGEVGRICAELAFGYNRHPAWDGDACDCCMESEFEELKRSCRFGAGPCVSFAGYEEFQRLRSKLDGCLTGCRLAKDRAASALSKVMIPEALDYPM